MVSRNQEERSSPSLVRPSLIRRVNGEGKTDAEELPPKGVVSGRPPWRPIWTVPVLENAPCL